MPKRRRHLPGKYQPKQPIHPNFTGSKPLALFQADNGLWGAKDGEGNIEIEPIYQRAPQTEEEKRTNTVRLVAYDHVISVTPEDWDLVAFCSPD